MAPDTDACPYSPATPCKKNKPCGACTVYAKWAEYKGKKAEGTQAFFESQKPEPPRKQSNTRRKKNERKRARKVARKQWWHKGMTFKEEYTAYIKSPVWKRKRDNIFKRDRGKCVVCTERAVNVHHWFYTKPYGEERGYQLGSVCSRCHELIHDEYADSTVELKEMKPRERKKEIEELKMTLLGHIAHEGHEEKEVSNELSLN